MFGIRSPLIINGTPVVTAPADLNVTNAGQLSAVLLTTAARGHATIVVDLTLTRFCDTTAFTVLAQAHQQARGRGGELRLVIPTGTEVFRDFTMTGLYPIIPWAVRLDQALNPTPDPARAPLPQGPIRHGQQPSAPQTGAARQNAC